MNKEAYIKPEMEVITLETETMIAASSISISIDRNSTGNDMLSNERRGTWGNLWDNGEE